MLWRCLSVSFEISKYIFHDYVCSSARAFVVGRARLCMCLVPYIDPVSLDSEIFRSPSSASSTERRQYYCIRKPRGAYPLLLNGDCDPQRHMKRRRMKIWMGFWRKSGVVS